MYANVFTTKWHSQECVMVLSCPAKQDKNTIRALTDSLCKPEKAE